MGEQVGESLVEQGRLEDAASTLVAGQASTTNLLLPTDHVCVQHLEKDAKVEISTGGIQEGWMGVDIGPETIATFQTQILQSKTIVWNGPMGVFETEPFDVGTREIAKAIATR